MACESLHSNAVKHQIHLEWTGYNCGCSLDSEFVRAFRSPFENSCGSMSVFRSNGPGTKLMSCAAVSLPPQRPGEC